MGKIDVRDDSDDEEPVRDSRGRFVPGTSGNRAGRPKRKEEPPPADLHSALVAAALEKIELTIGGQRVRMAVIEAVARGLMADALTLKGYERARVVSCLQRLGLFEALAQNRDEARCATEEEEGWTEEMDTSRIGR